MRIREPPTAGAGYVMAIAMTTLMFALHHQLSAVLGEFATYLPFIIAIIFASWFGGFWPGLMATVLGGIFTTYYLFPSNGATASGNVVRAVTVLVFLVIGVLTSALSEELHAARRLLEQEQAKLRENEAFNEIVAELSSDFVFKSRVGERGAVVVEAISDGFTKLFGYTLAELNALLPSQSILHPDDRPRVAKIASRLAAGETVEAESHFLARDARVVCVRYRMRPVSDRGRLLRVYGAASDVTAEREANAAVLASERRFRVMADTVPSIIWTAAPDGELTYVNDQWLKFCGLTPGVKLPHWPELAPHPDDLPRATAQWTHALQEGSEYEIEVRYRRHDGVYRWFVTRALPLKDETGHVVSWVGATTDIDEQKKLQEQLRRADRRKDEFLATLAHELRNPLAPVCNALEIIQRTDSDPLREEAFHIIERQVQKMVHLIDDLLDMSRITSGRLTLRRERVELATVLRDAVEVSRPLIDASEHALDVSSPPEPLYVYADPTRLAQVFANLLNNAAKFTPTGGTISLVADHEPDGIVVTVRDTGVGISRELLPRIFEMFTQGKSLPERTPDGLGIGLTIARLLVEMHGGRIEARSKGPESGSEFVVHLPVYMAETADRPAPRIKPPKLVAHAPPRRILVVEDNEDAAASLVTLLRLTSHDVRAASDGFEALAAAAVDHPEVVLLDIGLPKLSGYDVARRIREESWGKDILLVAMTGWGQLDDKRRSREAGFDLHLTKPVDPVVLDELLVDPRAAVIGGSTG
jgi:PAS domain S-box-containing protein